MTENLILVSYIRIFYEWVIVYCPVVKSVVTLKSDES